MSLQTIVQNAPLPQAVQKNLLTRIEEEGATEEVIQAVKDALQEYIDSGFQKLGVTIDPNDPKVQAITQTLNDELDDAEAEFEETLENLSIDAAVAQAKANKDLDAIQVSTMKAQIAS